MNPLRFDRRRFLQGLGVGLAALPLLSTDRVVAQATAPKRVIFVGWGNGYLMDEWRPAGGERDFRLGAILKPLESFRDRLLVIDGLGQRVHYEANGSALGWGKDQWYGGHDANPACLTGVPLSRYADFLEESGGDSLDQHIANELSRQVSLSFPSLVVGPFSEGGYNGTLSYRGKSPGVTPQSDPFALYKDLFAGRALPEGQIDKLLFERRSVLDYLDRSLVRFSERLGREDKDKVDQHLQAVRAIETRFMAAPDLTGCQPPGEPAPFSAVGKENMHNYPASLDLLQDLVLAAMRCDLTRVATIVYSTSGGDDLVFSWLGDEFTGPGDEYPIRQYHDITHNAGRSPEHRARKVRVEQWFYEQVAKLAAGLQATPEGEGSMLDHTLIVVTNSMGDNHDSHVVPFTLVGNLGGYFATGRSVKYDVQNGLGTAHNHVLVSIAEAMGVSTAFGDPRYASPLPGLRA